MRKVVSSFMNAVYNYSNIDVPACHQDDEAMSALYVLTCWPGAMLVNPLADFKARAEAGDFNPLTAAEEAMSELPENRQPMTEEEFEAAKSVVISNSAYWGGKPQVTCVELYQALVSARMRSVFHEAQDFIHNDEEIADSGGDSGGELDAGGEAPDEGGSSPER